jgi:hypothetical protein
MFNFKSIHGKQKRMYMAKVADLNDNGCETRTATLFVFAKNMCEAFSLISKANGFSDTDRVEMTCISIDNKGWLLSGWLADEK